MYDYLMEIEKRIKKLTLKQKLNQIFIAGFEGENPDKCKEFQELLKNGLGGVIFFTKNIKSKKQFQKIIESINKKTFMPLFLTIDQEGGRVERTENIHGCKKYLSAKDSAKKGIEFIKSQTKEISNELKGYGINMNYAPVLDVNTNKNNPVIGERAYSNKTDKVIKFASVAMKTYMDNSIIPVGKHFPGHGDASVDSHKNLPTINLSLDELEKAHIEPFKRAIESGIPAIMVAHVHYPCFDKNEVPSSLSENIINSYLIEKLGFKGLIISDDMFMGAVQGYSPIEACIKAINAGINMFIFGATNKNSLKLITELEKAVLDKKIEEKTIDLSLEKIFKLKDQYNIL